MHKQVLFATSAGLLLLLGFSASAFAQPETMAWGNLTGIRAGGQLLELNSSMCVVEPKWAAVSRTGRERQSNRYTRDGKIETVNIHMRPPRELRRQGVNWRFLATEVVEETGAGTAAVDLEYSFQDEGDIEGAYYCLELPAERYSGGLAELVEPVPPAPDRVSLAPGPDDQNEYVRAQAKGLRFIARGRRLELVFREPTEIIIRDDRRTNVYDLQVYITVISGRPVAGQTARKSLTISASGEIDNSPVEIALDASRPGQLFDGLGGNFRLQNPRTDPQVIQYSLDTVRLAWGRVELPWSLWHPDEDSDPLEAARAGKANARVLQAMEMAQRLARKGMPVIVSAWSAPAWATLGGRPFPGAAPAGAPPGARPPGGVSPAGSPPSGAPAVSPAAGAPAGSPPAAGAAPPGSVAGVRLLPPPDEYDGPRGNPLNPAKMDRIKESIAGYLIFLKERYGVEAAMFSFNESDLGINVRQTAREHAELIKTLGPYFASRGLATRLALGDTSDATPIDFIKPGMQDPEAAKYVGAVDFHSWRGCTDETLAKWRDAARALNVPLIVGEGSTDAAAYRYPQIFREPSFALYEINLYTRILSIAQPRSILQWQFTADYSVLAGGGIFGDNGPLRPTQRYWNLKQLASTPPRSFWLPVQCKAPGLTCAALGNIAEQLYTLHIVNNGASRPVTVSGLPPGVSEFQIWVTDARRGMEEGRRVPVTDGKAQLTLDPMTFTTLIGVPAATSVAP
jgi:hypothetical protein